MTLHKTSNVSSMALQVGTSLFVNQVRNYNNYLYAKSKRNPHEISKDQHEAQSLCNYVPSATDKKWLEKRTLSYTNSLPMHL